MNRLISWPGCKYRQLEDILSHIPEGRKWKAVCEPFLGTGAFSFSFAHRDVELYWAENNLPLVNWWHWLLSETDEFVKALSGVREEFIDAGADRDIFNCLRDGWNKENLEDPDSMRSAAMRWARTIFLAERTTEAPTEDCCLRGGKVGKAGGYETK